MRADTNGDCFLTDVSVASAMNEAALVTAIRSSVAAVIVTRDNIDDPDVARYLYVADCANYALANAEPMPAASPVATPTA